MPAIPPYSSATIARWWPSLRSCDSAVSTLRLDGMNSDGAGQLPDGQPAAAGDGEIADVHETDHVVDRAAHHRIARMRQLAGLLERAAHLLAGIEEGHLGTRDHAPRAPAGCWPRRPRRGSGAPRPRESRVPPPARAAPPRRSPPCPRTGRRRAACTSPFVQTDSSQITGRETAGDDVQRRARRAG